MRLRLVFAVLSIALALAGCAGPGARYAARPANYSELDARMYGTPGPQRTAYVAQPQSYVVQHAAQVVRQVVDEGPYTLDTGDKLRVVVFGQDALSNSYTVDAQGNVALPLVGAVTARGITTEQLAGSITARLKQNYLRDPSVAVEVEVYRPFFVLGEVTYPGQYPFVPNMTVENAIAIAGGFTPRAYRDKVTVTRKVQGIPGRMTLPLRYPLRPGDTIEVSERWF